MNEWIDDLREAVARGDPAMLLSIAGVRGSAPREIGARMIVTAAETVGTIGGGQLEYQCAHIAWQRLTGDAEPPPDTAAESPLRRFVLGANCGQCCGGVAEVLFERIGAADAAWLDALARTRDARRSAVLATSTAVPAERHLVTAEDVVSWRGIDPVSPALVAAARALLEDGGDACRYRHYLLEPIRRSAFDIAVFGAGHVGTELVGVLSRLDCHIRWIDGRSAMFPRDLPGNVLAVESADPAREAAAMPTQSYYLVMTHSHPLDLEICARILTRGDAAYCGLIGSVSKRRRFERLLARQGLPADRLATLTCPIGVGGIAGKRPAEIALAVAAEILLVRSAMAGQEQQQSGARMLRPVP